MTMSPSRGGQAFPARAVQVMILIASGPFRQSGHGANPQADARSTKTRSWPSSSLRAEAWKSRTIPPILG